MYLCLNNVEERLDCGFVSSGRIDWRPDDCMRQWESAFADTLLLARAPQHIAKARCSLCLKKHSF